MCPAWTPGPQRTHCPPGEAAGLSSRTALSADLCALRFCAAVPGAWRDAEVKLVPVPLLRYSGRWWYVRVTCGQYCPSTYLRQHTLAGPRSWRQEPGNSVGSTFVPWAHPQLLCQLRVVSCNLSLHWLKGSITRFDLDLAWQCPRARARVCVSACIFLFGGATIFVGLASPLPHPCSMPTS